MTKHKCVAAVILSILITLLVVGAVLITPPKHKVDVVEVNDIIENVAISIDDNTDYVVSAKYKYSVVEVGVDGEYLYNGIGIELTSYSNIISMATGNNYIMRDVLTGYKVIIDTDINNSIVASVNGVRWSFVGIMIAMILVILGYFAYIHYKLLRPFKKLDKFAEQVASGNLDEPLDMDRDNTFGVFQEAFDIMRLNIKTAQERERQAEADKKHAITELSHDIKLPIASIIAMSECAELKGDNKWASKIIGKANQVNRIINDIYNTTLDDIGELKVTIIDHDSSAIIGLIKDTDYKELVRIQEAESVLLRYDEFRLKQVLDNIIANSYKYADTNIDVVFEVLESELSISIRDYGNGVSDIELAKVTDKFYRGERSGMATGEGIGLYVAKMLLDRQLCRMECYNDNGFVVKIFMPITK